ncbi:hypothetical protein C8R46DRAFT_1030661 [Mycena filopes]|nr:hypothetical protein C8R46DRAFT_1030661 [Mycena filopes]
MCRIWKNTIRSPSQDIRHVAAGSGIGGTCADLGRKKRNEKPRDLPAITKPTAAGLGKEGISFKPRDEEDNKKGRSSSLAYIGPSQDIRHVAAGSGIGGTCADLGRKKRNEKPGDLPAITKPTAAGLGKEGVSFKPHDEEDNKKGARLVSRI